MFDIKNLCNYKVTLLRVIIRCCSTADPPGQPMITGYTPGTAIASGTVVKMSCISSGGNPLATLNWFKNDKKVSPILNSIIFIFNSTFSFATKCYISACSLCIHYAFTKSVSQ